MEFSRDNMGRVGWALHTSLALKSAQNICQRNLHRKLADAANLIQRSQKKVDQNRYHAEFGSETPARTRELLMRRKSKVHGN
jgi:hypothetical protein